MVGAMLVAPLLVAAGPQLAERNLAAPSSASSYQSWDFQQRRDVRTGVEQTRIAPWRNAAKSKTAENQAEEDQGQPASSQPSQAPTAAEPRNTNTDETMMERAPQSVREKTAMEKVGVMVWPSWAQWASGLLGPCLHFGASWPVDPDSLD